MIAVAQAPPQQPAAPPLLQDDPIARLAALIWLTIPRRLVARVPVLRDVAGDGHFLCAVPVVAVFLPVACLVGGLWVGATDWTYDISPTESVFLLSTLVVLGAFSTQLGLLALVGFAVGDFFVRVTYWSYTVHYLREIDPTEAAGTTSFTRPGTGLLDSGLVSGLWRVRLPLVIGYMLLGIGAVLVPRLARGIAGIALRTARVAPNLDWLVASFAYLVTIWLGVSGWASSLPLLWRPSFTWKGGLAGQMPPAQATVPIQHFRAEIVAAAVAAAMARQLLVLLLDRNRQAAARVDVVVSLAEEIPAPRPTTRREAQLRILGSALVATLVIAGMLERVWTWALAAAAFLLIALVRSEFASPTLVARWRQLAGRLPLLARVVVIIVGVRVLAGLMAESVLKSYESLAVFVVLAALGSVLLLPPPESDQ